MIIIWKALIEYLNNNLRAGRSVNIKRFGSFTFDIETELPRIATKQSSMGTQNFDIEDHRLDRRHVHKVRPCFVVDDFLQPHLIHFSGKEEILPSKSQKSIYQKGFRMIYCNPVPIAAACLLGKDVVTDALNTIFLAIVDLIKYNRDLNINFGFARVRISNRGLKVVYATDFNVSCGDKQFEQQMKRSVNPVSDTWKSSYTKTFAQSTLGTLLTRPNGEVVKTLNEKTMALKLMSLDLSSSGKFFSATTKGPFFPSTTKKLSPLSP
jgi:hypothetical protein